MDREPGFYWVRYNSNWMVAEWTPTQNWEVTHNIAEYEDHEWDEIVEDRLIPPVRIARPIDESHTIALGDLDSLPKTIRTTESSKGGNS